MPFTLVRRGFRSLAVLSSRAEVKAKLARLELERPFSPALIDSNITSRSVLKSVDPKLVDSFSRRHDYLRISLSERCNLRCFYCMPSEGVKLSPQGKILTNDEVIRLARLFVRSGVKKIRLTGGEPTLRQGLDNIISGLNELRQYGLQSIAMTTNGIALHRKLPQYVENGLTHINLSLDTLDPLKFEAITRRKGQEAVLRSLDVALSFPMEVKVNVVVIRGVNDSEVPDFLALLRDRPISIRFIEFMPFTGNEWDKSRMVPSSELLAKISAEYPELQRAPDELNDTARSYKIPGFQGSFGFISSMSDHFCASCNRLRITADGQIKVCLFDAKEVSLRDEMRIGASDDRLMDVIGQAVFGKQEKHVGMDNIDIVHNRPMILIDHRIRPEAPAPKRSTLPANLKFSRPHTFPHSVRYMSSKSLDQARGAKLSHLDNAGRAAMVDVSSKIETKRTCTASGRIYIPLSAFEVITSATYPDDGNESQQKARRKGDALNVAQLAAIMGAKQTSDLIPLCHPLALTNISVQLTPELPQTVQACHSIVCTATVSCHGQTGVEMEALTAVSVGLLTVWDMLKATAGQEMEIGDIKIIQKSGGKNDFARA